MRRNDLIFIAILLAIVMIAGMCLFFFSKIGDCVTVSVNGTVTAVYPLNEDRIEDIRTEAGGLNRLVIRNGKAWVETASCPDGICAAHKPIHREGESIICLPHKVVISVETTGHADTPDVVV
ncbi:MAG: NusG domain II-containing protein [Clostridia bacterium]|nr:NusG domain II-containing protein [Clostridia bacterium]